jgi:heavy metal sensor kinase
MFIQSIRWRLQLWLAFLLACVLSGFGVTVYELQRLTQLRQLDEELGGRVAALNQAVRSGGPREMGRHPPPDHGPEGRPGEEERKFPPDRGPEFRGRHHPVTIPPETAGLFTDTSPGAFYFMIWSRDGEVLGRSSNLSSEPVFPGRAGRDTSLHFRERAELREAVQFTELGDCVLVGRSLAADRKAQRLLAWMLLASGGAVMALGLGGGWWLSTLAIRPVEDISAAASRISAGNLSERIVSPAPGNELSGLAAVLNSTFSRLEAAFQQQRQFTADASHELRTPIAVIISEAQTALARERSAAEYREAIEANLIAAQQMRRLTDSLLTLARLDAGQELLQSGEFDLGEEAQASVDLLRPLATARRLNVQTDFGPARCHGDATRIAQVITNLVSNAIHYNREGGMVRIETRAEGSQAVLTVRDTGVGIAAADLSHIFERFYRADRARSSTDGRSGLGLAISKAIVEAHHGTISAESEPGIGTTITVRFPAGPEVA